MASRNVSFYGQGQRAPLGGGQIQSAYQDDPRRLMAEQLMKTGASGAPVQSVGEGITRALSGAAGGYFAGEARRDTEAKEADRRKKITDVLAGASAPVQYESAPALNVPAEFADMGAAIMGERAPTPTEQNQRMISGISGIDPDMGLQMQMQAQQGQIDRQRNAEAAQLARTQDLSDTKAAQEHAINLKKMVPGKAPVDGKSDPTSNMRDFAELQRLTKLYPPIDGKDSPQVATFKDFASKTNVLNVGSGFAPYDPATGGVGVEIPKGIGPSRTIDNGRVVTLPGVSGATVAQPSMIMGGGGISSAEPTGGPQTATAAPAGGPSVIDLPKTRDEIEEEAFRETGEESKAATNAQTSDLMQSSLDGALAALDAADADPLSSASGTVSRAFGWISGTNAGKLRSHIASLKSPIVAGAIQELRKGSAAGATGFGAMNEKELEILVNMFGALDPDTTDPAILRQSFARIQSQVNRVKADALENVDPDVLRRVGLGHWLQDNSGTGQTTNGGDKEGDDLLNKYAPVAR